MLRLKGTWGYPLARDTPAGPFPASSISALQGWGNGPRSTGSGSITFSHPPSPPPPPPRHMSSLASAAAALPAPSRAEPAQAVVPVHGPALQGRGRRSGRRGAHGAPGLGGRVPVGPFGQDGGAGRLSGVPEGPCRGVPAGERVLQGIPGCFQAPEGQAGAQGVSSEEHHGGDPGGGQPGQQQEPLGAGEPSAARVGPLPGGLQGGVALAPKARVERTALAQRGEGGPWWYLLPSWAKKEPSLGQLSLSQAARPLWCRRGAGSALCDPGKPCKRGSWEQVSEGGGPRLPHKAPQTGRAHGYIASRTPVLTAWRPSPEDTGTLGVLGTRVAHGAHDPARQR